MHLCFVHIQFSIVVSSFRTLFLLHFSSLGELVQRPPFFSSPNSVCPYKHDSWTKTITSHCSVNSLLLIISKGQRLITSNSFIFVSCPLKIKIQDYKCMIVFSRQLPHQDCPSVMLPHFNI